MTTHRLHCQEPWFSHLRSGIKTVEGRKNLPKYTAYQPGDTLIFYYDNEEFSTQIRAIRHYSTLDAYLQTEGVSKVLPGIETLEEARAIYLQWSNEEEIRCHGFLGIHILRAAGLNK